jgi:hypothetical protein
MLLIALAIGVILIVAAIRNSQDALFAALKIDVPSYVTIAAAILAVGAIGYIPNLKPVSRGLLALIFVVLILRNYQQIIAGFEGVASGQAASSGAASSSSSPLSAITGAISGAIGSTASGMTEQDLGQAFSQAGF